MISMCKQRLGLTAGVNEEEGGRERRGLITDLEFLFLMLALKAICSHPFFFPTHLATHPSAYNTTTKGTPADALFPALGEHVLSGLFLQPDVTH